MFRRLAAILIGAAALALTLSGAQKWPLVPLVRWASRAKLPCRNAKNMTSCSAELKPYTP